MDLQIKEVQHRRHSLFKIPKGIPVKKWEYNARCLKSFKVLYSVDINYRDVTHCYTLVHHISYIYIYIGILLIVENCDAIAGHINTNSMTTLVCLTPVCCQVFNFLSSGALNKHQQDQFFPWLFVSQLIFCN